MSFLQLFISLFLFSPHFPLFSIHVSFRSSSVYNGEHETKWLLLYGIVNEPYWVEEKQFFFTCSYASFGVQEFLVKHEVYWAVFQYAYL